MRLCRYLNKSQPEVALYFDDRIIPLDAAGRVYTERTHKAAVLGKSADLLDYLPPGGERFEAAREVAAWFEASPGAADGIAIHGPVMLP